MSVNIAHNDPEVKRDSATYASEVCESSSITEAIQHFSSWSRLKRVVAWILRYRTILQHLCRKQKMGNPVHSQPTGKLVSISGAELNNAENEILKHLQRQFFKQECQCLEQADQETTPSRQNVLKVLLKRNFRI